MGISAQVIADTEFRGSRLTTVLGTCHRFVLAELNTHRVFSRNSASSRAIPIEKKIRQVMEDPAIPIEFGANQKGMQAGQPIDDEEIARNQWLIARDNAVSNAREMMRLGVHKQVVNRLLEPFMWHTVVISSTRWENFFEQRCSPLAQPEIRAFAEAVREARWHSDVSKLVRDDEVYYHLPFITPEMRDEMAVYDLVRISVARCARTSYETHDGEIDVEKDLELYQRLVEARPMHASPLEHVAMTVPLPLIPDSPMLFRESNYGPHWHQFRHIVETGEGLDSLR